MQGGNIGLICTCSFMIIVLLNQSVHLNPMRNWLSLIKSPIINGLRKITKWKFSKFGKKSSAHVESLWEKFIRTKLSEREDARPHVINIIALTDELALQGRPIDDKTKIPTLDDSYLRSWLKWTQNWELTIFQLTLLNKRNLFLKEAKGLRRKENSKVTEVIEKVTRGLKTKQIFCYHCKEP